MNVLKRAEITDFIKIHADSKSSLESWYKTMKMNKFSGPEDLQKTFGNGVDIVGRGFVFNISGNKYRLAAAIHFPPQKCFIREIMTHAEYSKNAWKKRHKDFN